MLSKLEEMLRQEKYKSIANKYDLKYKFLQSIVLYVTSILKRNAEEKTEKLLSD